MDKIDKILGISLKTGAIVGGIAGAAFMYYEWLLRQREYLPQGEIKDRVLYTDNIHYDPVFTSKYDYIVTRNSVCIGRHSKLEVNARGVIFAINGQDVFHYVGNAIPGIQREMMIHQTAIVKLIRFLEHEVIEEKKFDGEDLMMRGYMSIQTGLMEALPDHYEPPMLEIFQAGE